LIAQVAALRERHRQLIDALLAQMGEISTQARDHMLAGRWSETGDLMTLQQGLLEGMGVSTATLHTLIQAARDSGAHGAKLSGAGGGDCMFALAPADKAQQVASAITAAGGQTLPFLTHAPGVRIESIDEVS
jgi:mevalonate kinase